MEGLVLPAAAIEEARVHAVEIGRKERGFVAAGARTNFDDRRSIVERIRRNERWFEGVLHLPDGVFDAVDLGARFGRQLGVVNDNEVARLRELVIEFLQTLCERDAGRQSLVLS